ncbi:MAG: bi-domain-containing oxidoreductase [Proteobacteria bacterium]|nr:bi-domain-containing oxidoreductase [Pseudomonadota bacterium]
MKQLLQRLDTGATEIVDVPVPTPGPHQILVRTRASAVSVGTERMLVSFGRSSLLAKARQQPHRVREVLDKVRADGLLTTLEAVRSKLATPIPLGYSNVGDVVAVGARVQGFEVGDRVATAGGHAEVVCVPHTLAAKVPEGVSDANAAFCTIGSIALQGVRLAAPQAGETIAVVGLGLIGLIAVQLLRAAGCRVLGIDFQSDRLRRAMEAGAETVDLGKGEDPVAKAWRYSRDRGIDAVIICTSTDSNDPLKSAARMSRKRGRIVLVGTAGLTIDRADFYEKELSFQVSCSYGPGRYDPAYEERGQDYPPAFVRWTAARNMEAFLDLVADGRVDFEAMVERRIPLGEAAQAYGTIDKSTLGLLLEYAPQTVDLPRPTIIRRPASPPSGKPVPSIGVIGAGNYASRVLVPLLRSAGARVTAVASRGGLSAALLARAQDADRFGTDEKSLIESPDLDAVVILTRHGTHADLASRALLAGKHVFVEKPLALAAEELDRVVEAYKAACGKFGERLLVVGFNRRFAPDVIRAKRMLSTIAAPKAIVITVNAGEIPAQSWVHDPADGGGRLLGEGCHFVDLACHLVGAKPTSVRSVCLAHVTRDTVAVAMEFADGSIASIQYFSNGHKAVPKEKISIFCAGRTIEIDNFRAFRSWGFSPQPRAWLPRLLQDKGHRALVTAFVEALRTGAPSPIPLDASMASTRATIDAALALES